MKFRTALAGCGNISRTHLEILNKSDFVHLVAVCDIDETKAVAASEKYNCAFYTSFEEMLENEILDCVHICTPHYLHSDMVCACLEKNINVLCEKPCAIDYEGIDKIKAALNNSNAAVGFCYQNRYNESTIAAKKLLEEKALGELTGVRASVYWSRGREYYSDSWHGKKEKEGGGVLINQAIHTLDLIPFIIGGELYPAASHCFNDRHAEYTDTEDTALLTFKTENGADVIFTATTAFSIDSDAKIELFCENGTIVVKAKDCYIIRKNGDIENLNTGNGVKGIGKPYWGAGHEMLINDFYSCLTESKKFSVDLSQAEISLKYVLNAYERGL